MKLLFFVFTCMFSIQVMYAQNSTFKNDFQNVVPEIDKRISGLLKTKNVKGLSIALVDSNSVIWSKGYGVSNYNNNTVVNQKTIFCFGSISKLFTSIAILQLHEQGKLDIDKSVQFYIPEFNPLGAEDFIQDITIKSILSHHSGLPSDNYAMFFTDKPYSSQNIIDYLNTQYVCTKPYTISSYSNIAYSLLGAIIERVSGQNFTEYVKTNITIPLGMFNSSFDLEENMKPLLSSQYLKGNKEYSEPHVSELLPAGGFYSNIEDMSIFTQMLLNKGKFGTVKILNESTFLEMVTVQNSNVHLDYDMTMGLTFFITLDGTWFKAGGSFSHGGNTLVFHSALTVLPYQNMAIIISSNSKNGMKIVPNIERFVLEKALDVKGIDTLFPKQIVSKPQSKKYITPGNYSDFEGLYSFMFKPLRLQAKKNKIVLNAFPIAFVLKPEMDSSFSVKIRLLGISFKNKNISKMWFDIVNNDTIIVATSWDRNFYFSNKLAKQSSSIIDKWKNIEGKYTRTDSSKIFNTITIKIRDGYIFMKSSEFENNKFRITAVPFTDSCLKVCGLGRDTGDVISFSNNTCNYAGISYLKKK